MNEFFFCVWYCRCNSGHPVPHIILFLACTSPQLIQLIIKHVKISPPLIHFRYDVPEISKYLDYINIMSYDFHGMWDSVVGHNSPLLPIETASNYQKKLTVVSWRVKGDGIVLRNTGFQYSGSAVLIVNWCG